MGSTHIRVSTVLSTTEPKAVRLFDYSIDFEPLSYENDYIMPTHRCEHVVMNTTGIGRRPRRPTTVDMLQ